MGFLMELLFIFLFGPVLALFALFMMLGDIARFYGLWLPPAVFGLAIGVQLQMVGPSDPYATYESLVQAIAGSHVAGVQTPSALIALGVFCLLVKPIYCGLSSRKAKSESS
jgi:hypothetical protein